MEVCSRVLKLTFMAKEHEKLNGFHNPLYLTSLFMFDMKTSPNTLVLKHHSVSAAVA